MKAQSKSVNQQLQNPSSGMESHGNATKLEVLLLRTWAAISRNTAAKGIIYLLPVTIFLLTTGAFLPALQNGFVNWDDELTLVTNSNYRGLGWKQVQWMFTTFYMGHYQPLSWLSFSLDYSLWGLDPFGFHLTNIVLHGINAVLVYFVSLSLFSVALRKSVSTNQLVLTAAACFSALLFGVHPLRVESVVWATQRRDVLSSFFLLWTTLFYLKATAYPKRNFFYRCWMIAALAVYVLSLFSKAAGITFPLVLAMLDVYPLSRLDFNPAKWLEPKNRHVLCEKLPFVFLASIYGVVALFAQQEAKALKPLEWYGVSSRIAQAVFGIVFYLWKTIFPSGLSPLYELPTHFDPLDPIFVVSGLVVVGATFGFLLMRHRWPAGFVIWISYVAILIPVLGTAQSGPQITADRYSYLSCLGWAVLMGPALFYYWPDRAGIVSARVRFTISAAVATGLLATFGVLTWNQTHIWHDSEKLWRHAVALRPDSATARYNLGFVLNQKDALDAAEEQYRQSLMINPDAPDAHTNLGRILARRGNFDEAIQHYLEALRVNPSHKNAYKNLAALYARRQDFASAIGYYQGVLKIDPTDADAHYNLGVILAQRGDREGSAKHYQSAAQINPPDAETQIRLAEISLQQRDVKGAVAHLEEALKVTSDDSEAHFKLGTLMALQGRLGDAADHLQRVLQSRPDFAEAHHNLGRVRAAQGNLNQAVDHFREAVRIQPEYAAAHESLAIALEEQGKRDEALKERQQAQRLQNSKPRTTVRQ